MSLNRLVAFASVVDANSCSIMAAEDGLLVLAITRKVPGTVACRLSAVITTSEGGLYSLVMVLTSNHRTLAQFAITLEGLTVMSIETVASYPTAAASCCAMATRRSRWCMLAHATRTHGASRQTNPYDIRTSLSVEIAT